MDKTATATDRESTRPRDDDPGAVPRMTQRFGWTQRSVQPKPVPSQSEIAVHNALAMYKEEDYFADVREEHPDLINKLTDDIRQAWLFNLDKHTAPAKLRKDFLHAFAQKEQYSVACCARPLGSFSACWYIRPRFRFRKALTLLPTQ